MKRAHVLVHGSVQGVFFRAETRNRARALGVEGWVRNTRDGAVEAVFEGDDERELRLAGALEQLKRLTGTDLVDHPVNAIPQFAETVARRGADAQRLLVEGAAMSVDEAVRYALREP